MQQYRIIISGGGTGGHVFPAIAIANALKKIHPEVEILFVGANGRMEMEKVPEAGYKIVGLNIMGFQRRLTFKNLIFPFKVMGSLMKARSILKHFNPDVVVGVGGYASGPVLRVATKRKIKTLIQEQNSFPGVTNRILSAKVNRICVAYEGMERFFPESKIIMTGNPVREEVVEIQGKKEQALNFFGIKNNKKTILVVGGSLGARTINESLLFHLETIKNSDVQLIWQTGKNFYATEGIASLNQPEQGMVVLPFIKQMDMAYAAADIIISRAGAIAISELCLIGKPVILVPSPNVSEDHQTKNAMALTKIDAAVMIKDIEAKEKLVPETLKLLTDDTTCASLSQNIIKLGKRNAADAIAGIIMDLITKNA
jgi:UDP-N-acetylglucosamine--N-acetylmuramyl-(pentapeptide) pyrophosphoryl-undecaprenol N-acetylglucosamine transferase